MDTLNRKVSANHPSTNDEGQTSNASIRDLKVTYYFVKACLDQVTNGEHVGTCFTKKGWQVKNMYDSLRKEWKVWYNLFGKVIRLGWNFEKNIVDENPQYAKFRDKRLRFAHQLTTHFKDVMANGEQAWAPSSGVLPN
ncbi:hypothetical protein MTR_3g448480 [Medicago truncatula]|uniref:Myb/SANT-like domain-containing protein n=1 Tax=Medicago truncatula TaxID=3880 RepID=A0A072UVD7_MEDTR|nr:hypothetical protein MTR_3g448480 [Medicago truncatula]